MSETFEKTDTQRIDFIESRNTLHDGTDFLYVVDGYEITVFNTARLRNFERVYHGETIRECIDKAIDGEKAISQT